MRYCGLVRQVDFLDISFPFAKIPPVALQNWVSNATGFNPRQQHLLVPT